MGRRTDVRQRARHTGTWCGYQEGDDVGLASRASRDYFASAHRSRLHGRFLFPKDHWPGLSLWLFRIHDPGSQGLRDDRLGWNAGVLGNDPQPPMQVRLQLHDVGPLAPGAGELRLILRQVR